MPGGVCVLGGSRTRPKQNSKKIFFNLTVLFAFPFLGGAVASEPVQRQLAAHLCELEPERRSLVGVPGGEAERRRPRTGSRSSHKTCRKAHIGARAGKCMMEWVKDWMNECVLTEAGEDCLFLNHLTVLSFFSRIPWAEGLTPPKPWLESCPRWVFGTGSCPLPRWPAWLAVEE